MTDMTQAKFTDRYIQSLKTERTQEDFWDTNPASCGLGIRVTDKGTKTFTVRYRAGAKKQRRMKIGRYPAISLEKARQQARAIRAAIDEGNDPQVKKQLAKKAETVDELFEMYIQDKAGVLKVSTLSYYQGIYDREIRPTIGSYRAIQLDRRQVSDLLVRISKDHPTLSERTRAIVLAVLNHGVGRGMLKYNPIAGIPNYGSTGIGTRFLDEEEITTYLSVIRDLPQVEQIYFRLLLMLGMRPGELAALRWEFVETDRIIIPASYQKNKRELHIPLVGTLAAQIKRLKLLTGSTEFLFPGPDTTRARQSFRKYANRIEKKVGVKPWTLRDIRRTTETHMREIGTDSEVVAALLNHNTTQLRKVYDKGQRIEGKKVALINWCGKLKSIEDELENFNLLSEASQHSH